MHISITETNTIGETWNNNRMWGVIQCAETGLQDDNGKKK